MFFSADFFPLLKKKCIFVVGLLWHKVPEGTPTGVSSKFTSLSGSDNEQAFSYARPEPLTWSACYA